MSAECDPSCLRWMKWARGVDCAAYPDRPLPTTVTVVTAARAPVIVTVRSSRSAEALALRTPTNPEDFAVVQPSSAPYSRPLISR